MAPRERTLRLTIGPEAVAVVLVGIAAGFLLFGIAGAAHRTIGWAVACAVVAAVIEPAVTLLDRRLPRVLSVAIVLLVVGLSGIAIATGILADIGNQFDRLREDVPEAAAELEAQESGLGSVARDFRLEQRATEVIDRLNDPTSGLASRAATTSSAYFVCAILTAFFLSWGPRVGGGALAQVDDDERRDRIRRIARTAFARARRYVLAAIGRAVLAGVVTWGVCYLEDVPAPIVLGVMVAGLSVVPGFGILFGCLPALLLEAGLGTGTGVLRLAAVFTVLQALDVVAIRFFVSPRSLVVGPAVIVVTAVIGFEVYGIGGALYGAALAVFGVAALDSAGGVFRAAAVKSRAAAAPAR